MSSQLFLELMVTSRFSDLQLVTDWSLQIELAFPLSLTSIDSIDSNASLRPIYDNLNTYLISSSVHPNRVVHIYHKLAQVETLNN